MTACTKKPQPSELQLQPPTEQTEPTDFNAHIEPGGTQENIGFILESDAAVEILDICCK